LSHFAQSANMLVVTVHIVCNYHHYHDHQPEGSQADRGGSTHEQTRKHKYEFSESLKGGIFLLVSRALSFLSTTVLCSGACTIFWYCYYFYCYCYAHARSWPGLPSNSHEESVKKSITI